MKLTSGLRAGLVGSVSMVGLLAAPTLAQTAPAQTAQAAPANTGIEEIVVTAQRTAQSLQDVPIAVSAFTSETLQRQQINNSADLQLTLPNITFTKGNFTGSSFTIRGIGDLCVGTTCDSATAIHINDLPLFGTRLFETEFFDLERVEVLRGPQGTLFGRNATAGVINFITAKPTTDAFHAAGEGDYGNYNSIRLKGMINVPIGENLAARVAGFYLKRDGYTTNVFDGGKLDGREMYAIRGSVRWTPTDNTTVDLMGYYFREDDNRLRIQKQVCQRDPSAVLGCLPGRLEPGSTNGNSTLASILGSKEFIGIALGAGLTPVALGSVYGPDVYGKNPVLADPRQVNTAYQPTYFTDEVQVSAKVEHDFGNIKAKVSGLYQRNSVDSSQDYNLSVQDKSLFVPGLSAFQQFGAVFPALATAGKALIPNGPNGPYCTSLPEETGTGLFGGHSICTKAPVAFDRSNNRNEAYTGEAIVNSQFDGRFNFLVGGIYNQATSRNTDYYVNAFGLDYASALLGLGTPGTYAGTPFYRNNTAYFRLKSYGLFGEGYFDVTSNVKLTVGVRYNHDDKLVQARTTLYQDTKSAAIPGLIDALGRPIVVSVATVAQTPYTATNFTQSLNYAQLDFDPTLAGTQPYQVNQVSFGRVTGRAVLDWKVTDDNLLYVSYSRGYKSGGINPPLSPIFAVPTTFAPESIDAFEVGSKNTFLDGTLRLNLTAFYYKYKGLQLSRIVARTSVNDNIDANIYGLEMDAIIEPVRALQINLGASYLHTEVANDKFLANPRDPSGGNRDAVIIKDVTNASNCAFVPVASKGGTGAGARGLVAAVNGSVGLKAPEVFAAGSGLEGTYGAFSICSALAQTAAQLGAPYVIEGAGVATNLKGNQLPQAPKFKFSAGIQYTVDFGNGMSLVPRADLAFTGESYGNIFNGFVNRIPSYEVINAQVQLNGPEGKWYVRGYVQNLTDNNATTGLYVTDQSSGLFTNIFTLEPRRYGIAAGFKF
ncbi:MAG: TonB-dependent receptor [Sandarakinorhabdus sp.]|nr:TonB-dependent receptor [Sandarakinorhabdus sp.]